MLCAFLLCFSRQNGQKQNKKPTTHHHLQHAALHFRNIWNATQCHHHFGKKKAKIIQGDQEICEYHAN